MSRVDTSSGRQVKPGAILRALGATDDAIQARPWHPEPADALRADGCLKETSVELMRDGGRVVRILVKCKCGETTSIECDYGETAAGAPSVEAPASK